MIPPTTDCSLLKRAFDSSSLPWTFEQKSAVAGYASWNNCEQVPPAPGGLTWLATFSPGWLVPTLCSPVVPPSAIYNALTNPDGARCTIHDNNVNALGIDPRSGFARRPLDNVGVQYGLAAFKAGVISAEQFIDLNERIGGFDPRGNWLGTRYGCHPTTLRLAYARGRVNTGEQRAENRADRRTPRLRDKNPDIHDRERSLMTPGAADRGQWARRQSGPFTDRDPWRHLRRPCHPGLAVESAGTSCRPANGALARQHRERPFAVSQQGGKGGSQQTERPG